MYAGFETAKVEFEGNTVVVAVDSKDGITIDWAASCENDKEFILSLTGFERALSRAIDSDNGIGEYKFITVTMA